GDSISLEIGNTKAKVEDREITLDEEPIIYKSGVYMHSKDIEKLLEDNFNVELADDKIVLEYIGPEKNPDVSSNNKDTNSNNDKKPVAGTYVFSILIIGFVLVLLKKNQN